MTMKTGLRIALMTFLASGTLLMSGCQSSKETQKDKPLVKKADTFQNSMDSVSYILGTNVYKNFQQGELGINDTFVLRGLRDAIQETDTVLSEEESRAIMQRFQQKMQAKRKQQKGNRGEQGRGENRRQARQEKAQQNLKESQAFLKENRQKDGVKSTESGLQYKVMEEGNGPTPSAEDTVRVHYKGKLKDGSEFDNSYKRNEPAEFPVNGVIQGWQEGLQLMKEGAEYKLFVPPELGYGQRGAGRQIGPNEVLIFEVELMEVK